MLTNENRRKLEAYLNNPVDDPIVPQKIQTISTHILIALAEHADSFEEAHEVVKVLAYIHEDVCKKIKAAEGMN